VDIEKLKQRRQGLEAQRESLAANLNATIGALQMLDELIAEQSAPSVEDEIKAREVQDPQ
jgi:hypothetical protein